MIGSSIGEADHFGEKKVLMMVTQRHFCLLLLECSPKWQSKGETEIQ